MSWVKRQFGLDLFDLGVHVGVTVMALAFIAMSNGPEELFPVVTAGSLVALAFRRRRGLRLEAAETERGLTSGQMAAARLEEVEQRLADLEAVQSRLVELEERLDFTERLLARSSGERAGLPEGR